MNKATKEAYEKAMSQGFVPLPKWEVEHGRWMNDEEDYLRPSFWKSLAKAIGWKESYTKDDPEWKKLTFGQMKEKTPKALCFKFYTHIWDGGDADSFFDNLLK